jgi:hypothetical protein
MTRYLGCHIFHSYNEELAIVQDWMIPIIMLTRLSCHVPYYLYILNVNFLFASIEILFIQLLNYKEIVQLCST